MNVCVKSRKGVAKLSVAETINLMIQFGIFTITLIGLIVTIVFALINKDNKK